MAAPRKLVPTLLAGLTTPIAMRSMVASNALVDPALSGGFASRALSLRLGAFASKVVIFPGQGNHHLSKVRRLKLRP